MRIQWQLTPRKYNLFVIHTLRFMVLAWRQDTRLAVCCLATFEDFFSIFSLEAAFSVLSHPYFAENSESNSKYYKFNFLQEKKRM